MTSLQHEFYPCSTSELDLFMVPPTQNCIMSSNIVEHEPLAPVTNQNGTIQFNILPSTNQYTDIGQMYLYLKVRIKKNQKDDVDATSIVAMSNLFMHSLFNQVEINLNNVKVTSGSEPTYPYRCMIETLLNFGEEAKKTHLTSEMFYKDTAGRMDSILTTDQANQGFLRRRVTSSKEIELYGRVHADVCFQNRFLPNNIAITVKLNKNNASFCLMGDNKVNYSIFYEKALLYVRKVDVQPEIVAAHYEVLKSVPMKYPLTRVETCTFNINKGLISHTQSNLSPVLIPKRVIFALVDHEAYNGSYSKNCFNFKHYNVSNISLTYEDNDVPGSPLNMDFAENCYLNAYYGLFQALDRGGLDWGNNITKEEFAQGYSLFAFDLSPNKCIDGNHLTEEKRGNLKVKFNFKEPLPEVVSVITYMEYDSMFTIDKNKTVVYNAL